MRSVIHLRMADETDKFPRRLRAVLLADMKDYSAIMGEDEAHAIAGVDDVGAIFQRVVPRHGGTFEITSGDRFFAQFESVVEAFDAALEIQRDLAGAAAGGSKRPVIRMGMHLGEVVDTTFGPMGDTINVAARLEALAEPGGIAVSEDVHRAVRNRFRDVTFRDLGMRELRNIREPVRVYAVSATPDTRAATPPRDTDRPGRRAALAVLLAAVASGVGWRWWPALTRRRPRHRTSPRLMDPSSLASWRSGHAARCRTGSAISRATASTPCSAGSRASASTRGRRSTSSGRSAASPKSRRRSSSASRR